MHRRRTLRVAVALAGLGIGAWVVLQRRDELAGAGVIIEGLHWPWAAVALALAGCAGPRNSLNTSASVCFRAIPTATNAVGHRGRLVGVRRRSHAFVARQFPGVTTPPSNGPVCVVAFRGNYHAGEIRGTNQSGRYAVVAVEARSRHVLRVRVTNKLPLRFQHRL